MTSEHLSKFLIFTMTICIVSAAVGCSTFTPIPTATAISTETATSTKIPTPSATITSTSEPYPTPYTGPNILFYIQDDNRLFSISANGSNPREIAQGLLFAISPDKKKLIYRTAETFFSTDDEVVVWDMLQKKIIYKWNIPGYCEGVFRSSEFNWSPDSQKVAFILGAYDAFEGVPDCGLQFNYDDNGIYQIDLTSAKITHPPIDPMDYSLFAPLSLVYSPDSLKLRIGARGQAFDAETWKPVNSESFYDLQQLGNQPEKIGICDDFNLCLYSENRTLKNLTKYDKSWEGVETFKLFANGSDVVYQTPDRQLHLLSLSNESDETIGNNVWEYFVTPDNNKIVFYERDRFVEDANIFIVNNDGSNKHSIAEFPLRHSPIRGLPMVLSPTGEKVAFVNREGIAIIDLDGNNFVQIVYLPDDAPADKISLGILDWY